MSVKRSKDDVMKPSELISLFACESFKRNGVPIFDRAYEGRRIYNIMQGRNIPYNYPQILFFKNLDSDFYGTFKEIAELNNVEGACINDLSGIKANDFAEYKEKCIKVRKGAKAEYLFSYSPHWRIREGLSDERRKYAKNLLDSRDYAKIRCELEDKEGVLDSLSWVVNYARLFSSNDILNLNPEYLERRRNEIELETEGRLRGGYDADECFSAVKRQVMENSDVPNSSIDAAAVISEFAEKVCNSFSSRAKNKETDCDGQRGIARELVQNMVARACGMDDVVKMKRVSPFKHTQAERFASIDGDNIYSAVITAEIAYRKFNSICRDFVQERLQEKEIDLEKGKGR